jgi:hypothetical protein
MKNPYLAHSFELTAELDFVPCNDSVLPDNYYIDGS